MDGHQCELHKSEGAVVEKTVPIQNDFPTYERQERDRSEPQFRSGSLECLEWAIVGDGIDAEAARRACSLIG